MYAVILLSASRQKLKVLSSSQPPIISRRLNVASPFSVEVPYSDEDLGSISLASLVNIQYKDFSIVGKVTQRDVTSSLVKISGFTEEILLTQEICPQNYGVVFENIELPAAVKYIERGWHITRLWDATQWSNNIASATSNIDLVTEPHVVMLARDGTGRYQGSGSIVVGVDSSTIAGFHHWERVRWLADFADDVAVSLQYELSATAKASGFNWQPSTSHTLKSGDPPVVIIGARGSEPETRGLELAESTLRYLYLRFNLVTADTTTPSNVPAYKTVDALPTLPSSDYPLSSVIKLNTNSSYYENLNNNWVAWQDTFGVTPYLFACEVISRTGIKIPFVVSNTTGNLVHEIKADQSNALNILQDLCAQHDYEFIAFNGQIFIDEKFGGNLTHRTLLTDRLV